ncbi:glutathione S-transferase [Cribrihabitans marinus]|uniref:Glutathione S-transferase n=1 Tax=Cribrihabitans marinus TaxID=1227549 RepID=A0A1H6XK81_9RHOB|nr:glutathione S-transferase family protein [Cribrihabitans marinus]GGH27594.1 glutathione S-transferase [Cribrihabitans marinus]SEJ29511.1 glutathione S-transferase [Cribrihabitans marinus]
MYHVYGVPMTRTFRVLWLLEELGEPYEASPLPPRSPEIRALNPTGKVPVLRDGEAVITDSTAILTYLSDKHGRFTHPAGTPARAHQDSLTHQILDELDATLWTAARHSFILPEEQRCPEVKDSLKWEFARNLDVMADRIEGPFLQGEEMTIADIILTHCLNWARAAKFPTGEAAILDYGKRMRGRDAFKRVAAASG